MNTVSQKWIEVLCGAGIGQDGQWWEMTRDTPAFQDPRNFCRWNHIMA